MKHSREIAYYSSNASGLTLRGETHSYTREEYQDLSIQRNKISRASVCVILNLTILASKEKDLTS